MSIFQEDYLVHTIIIDGLKLMKQPTTIMQMEEPTHTEMEQLNPKPEKTFNIIM